MTKNNNSLQLVLLMFMLLGSCNEELNEKEIRKIANQYYRVYQQKEDFQAFMNFYSEHAVLEDIINGDVVTGRKALANFFDWSNPDLSRDHPKALIIKNQIIEGNSVVTKGYFTSFKWKSQNFGPMHFITILEFDIHGKIKKQIDWINYPSRLVDYENRKDSNQWIND